ncbi:MAG: KH domain-containing protein [Candidatus Magasanikbacteria bacterium]|nr:KH domain-containing protein [Candidatus Magasanikbacteria bacterium]
MEHKDQEFVEFLVKAIVNNPNDVKTSRIVDERGVLITLDINPTDMGYVIGRQGQTARSIRTLLKIVGAKNNARVNLKINEPEGGRGPRRPMMGGMDNSQTNVSNSMNDVDTSAIDNLTI